jgi:hypothetical protein
VISGLPARQTSFNGTYAPTGQLVEGYPAYAAGPDRHLFRHPQRDQWFISNQPFDPTKEIAVAYIDAASGLVPTGRRAWTAFIGGKLIVSQLTARVVA